MINIGEVASFIDNVIMGIEKKDRYNEIVEEVVKRLVEGKRSRIFESSDWTGRN